MGLRYSSGQGIGTWQAGLEFEPSTTKDSPYKTASQTAEIVNGVYGVDTVTANKVQFWFRRFHSGIFDIKDASRTGRPVVENVDKITD
ncbi:histone-lysine N-methyltransferase SETMAR [Trichonephila clavipes]|nr:histone-lysine N-methyltransferase SETMAR [Trichonephila clavipes]